MITTLNFRTKLILLSVLIVVPPAIVGQTSLDHYLETSLKNNLVLQQKTLSLEKAMYALKLANSMFLPSIAIKGDYQSGEGGRSIAIPLGDIMNPVYSTLNQLTMSESFPQISNVETNFFPEDFYDIKIRTSMPIFNTDLLYNRSIQKNQVLLKQFEVDIYTQELIKDIKVAYYNYLSAANAVAIYESSLELAREGKRINETLVNNGKSLKAYVLRSESEIQNLEAKKTEANEKVKNARMYFNFLINASPDHEIDTTSVPTVNENEILKFLSENGTIDNRTELKALDVSDMVYKNAANMVRNFWTPRVNAFVDLGSQSSHWKFTNQSKYYFFGFQLEIPLFASGQNTYKIKLSELEQKKQLTNSKYISNQIQLSMIVAKNNLRSSFENYAASLKELNAATAYYKLIEKGYKEGTNTFLESIDARNQITVASLQTTINKYQLMAAVANYEREIQLKK